MLENLRDKIINVQQDLSASLRSLTTGESSSFRSNRTLNYRNCNLNAGADLLHHYQCKWEDLHNIAEENAKTAENIDKLIGDVHKYSEEKLNAIQQLNSQLSLLPKLHNSIQALMTKIGELEGLFEEVESSILYLEDMIETQELQEKQLDYRFQLALFQKKKLAEYEQTKVKLAGEHAYKVLEFEQKQQSVLQERQEAFREAFEEEMNHYKAHGRIERISSCSSGSGVLLSDINLENDRTDLDAFLAEEATENSFIPVTTEQHLSSEETDTSTDVEKV
ncbi:dysbindin-like [Centruroides sculpturatus]|uniref:dysbindin-like n=1 Tax=Centruroides sculpturatus TaxID=218467 RepID=UPI000C6CED4C|nr:dysbindin-like [Centruroides sculpturatus]